MGCPQSRRRTPTWNCHTSRIDEAGHFPGRITFGVVSSGGREGRAGPAGFTVRDIAANGTTIHVRVGGKGPAVVLLHGFGDTGDMWAPLAARLVEDHTVVVPDLRGMGLSSHPETGYDKKNEAQDIAAGP